MRLQIALTLSAVASAASGSLIRRQSIPSCASECIVYANTGGCAPTDNACLCKDGAFIGSITTCIEHACSSANAEKAEEDIRALCAAVGVPLA
ncbi:hypothetical protein C8Q80DRAFT_480775 [Daedaleopsis nitida]|nr:hypothetical protein C8Q80DRAFT_480775 [Daedaleopsis nitida]